MKFQLFVVGVVVSFCSAAMGNPIPAERSILSLERDSDQFFDFHESFGAGLAGDVDIDGDGTSDVIIGHPQANTVYVHSGKSGECLCEINAPPPGPCGRYDLCIPSAFGESVAGGDVDGDGIPDVIIGAPGTSIEEPGDPCGFGCNGSGPACASCDPTCRSYCWCRAGEAYVYSGADCINLGAQLNPMYRINGTAFDNDHTSDEFGKAISAIGDTDGVAGTELVIGAPGHDLIQNGCPNVTDTKGRVFLWSRTNETIAIWDGNTPLAGLGRALDAAGDVDGDFVPDFLAGAHRENNNRGAAYIYSGSGDQKEIVKWTVPETVGEAYFGSDVASAGDINNDGIPDAIIGASNYQVTGGVDGRVFVYLGTSTNPTYVFDGFWESLGRKDTLSGVGDVNNDGFGDFAIGSRSWDCSRACTRVGRLLIYSGADGSVLCEITGDDPNDPSDFGHVVARGGDINGDMLDDVLVGERDTIHNVSVGRVHAVTCATVPTLPIIECDAPPYIIHAAGQPGETRPFSGYVDPRAESNNGTDLNMGLDELTIVFSEPVFAVSGGPVTPASFEVTTTGKGAPSITSVDAGNNPTIVVHLGGFIPLQEWTTVRAIVEDVAGTPIVNNGNLGPGVNELDRVDIAFLPADVDQNGFVSPLDLIRFRQILYGTVSPDFGISEDYIDTDRNALIQPYDLLRFRQLIYGTSPATQIWQGEFLNSVRP